jgi:hypothetical protein
MSITHTTYALHASNIDSETDVHRRCTHENSHGPEGHGVNNLGGKKTTVHMELLNKKYIKLHKSSIIYLQNQFLISNSCYNTSDFSVYCPNDGNILKGMIRTVSIKNRIPHKVQVHFTPF